MVQIIDDATEVVCYHFSCMDWYIQSQKSMALAIEFMSMFGRDSWAGM